MQEIKYFEKPGPHIIIDNFFSNQNSKAILDEAIKLEPFYTQAMTIGAGHTFDGCKQCEKIRKASKLAVRDNTIISLDHQYKNKRYESVILSSFGEVLKDPNFINILIDKPSTFALIDYVNTSESLLSRYGQCDFYKWHIDNTINREQRLITIIYYFNKEPEKFTGGELLFGAKSTENYKIIKPKHNRLIIFPSDMLHSVNDVKFLDSDFGSARFSLNLWVGFNNVHKF